MRVVVKRAPKTHLTLVSFGHLADCCCHYCKQLKKRDMLGFNRLRQRAVLQRQVSTYKKLMFALAQADAPPRVGRIIEVLVNPGHRPTYILYMLLRASVYKPCIYSLLKIDWGCYFGSCAVQSWCMLQTKPRLVQVHTVVLPC